MHMAPSRSKIFFYSNFGRLSTSKTLNFRMQGLQVRSWKNITILTGASKLYPEAAAEAAALDATAHDHDATGHMGALNVKFAKFRL